MALYDPYIRVRGRLARATPEELKRWQHIVEGYKADGKKGVAFSGTDVPVDEMLKLFKAENVRRLPKGKLPANVQPFRGGFQFVTGGHVFERDKYRPNKVDMFQPGRSKNHLRVRCTECGQTWCPHCYPKKYFDKCSGKPDLWPTTKETHETPLHSRSKAVPTNSYRTW